MSSLCFNCMEIACECDEETKQTIKEDNAEAFKYTYKAFNNGEFPNTEYCRLKDEFPGDTRATDLYKFWLFLRG